MKKIALIVLLSAIVITSIQIYKHTKPRTQPTTTTTDIIAKEKQTYKDIHGAGLYFGNEAKGDLTGDNKDDVAFLITQDSGGSGTFYYVVVAIKTPDGYKNTNPFLIGDRIAPQSTEIHSDSKELYVNFAQRKPTDPMTTPPSVGATLFLKVTPDGVLEGLMK